MEEKPASIDRRTYGGLPDKFLLSVVVPVFNEKPTLTDAIERIRATDIPCEIILVDDGSTDGSRDLIWSWRKVPGFVVASHAKNQGKGAAVRTGLALATGQAVVVQDADLEYDPRDFWKLLEPIVNGRANVVFGSRFAALREPDCEGIPVENSSSDREPDGDWGNAPPNLEKSSHPRPSFWHRAANRLLTVASNWTTGLRLTDMETCYKMMRWDISARIAPVLRENGFGIEPEITARLAHLPEARICEVPISYRRRSYAAGKKIRMRDAAWALWCIARYGIFRR